MKRIGRIVLFSLSGCAVYVSLALYFENHDNACAMFAGLAIYWILASVDSIVNRGE